MIVELIFNSIFSLFGFIFGAVSFPPFPAELQNSINSFMDTFFENLSLLGLFCHVNTLKICIPVVLLILAFEKAYKLVMFILRKIPFLGIH
jgi:hypothetical protein|nr:MAG TPA: hypothetical protein [Inoviridae sp.]